MTDDRKRETPTGAAGEDEVAALFRLAGAPPTLSEDEVRPARDAARETWRRQVRALASRRRQAWAATAVAASLVAAVALTWWLRERIPAPPSGPVASLELRTGGVTILPGPGAAAGGPSLVAGTVLSSGPDGRVAIRLAGGASVRVDGGSRVRLASPRSLDLELGGLYVDSGASPGEPIEIDTPLGRVTDVGTQFEVRLAPAGERRAPQLRLRVREGLVRMETESATHHAEAGHELLVDADGRASRTAVTADDPGWHWAVRAAPGPEIEGRTLASFLDWATRELGLRWRLVEPRPTPPPGQIVLHGSVAGLTPEEAIEVVLTGSGLRAERVEGELRISAAAPRAPIQPR